MLGKSCLIAWVCVVGVVAVVGQAHSRYTGETWLHDDAERVQVQHKLVWHDVVGALHELDGVPLPDEISAESEARIRAHIEARFRLFTPGGEQPLRWLGVQKQGDVLWVHQQIDGRLRGQVQVWHALLGEVYPLQVNWLHCNACTGTGAFNASNIFVQSVDFP